MKNLALEYLNKQESSKWLHNNNDYDIHTIKHNTNSDSSLFRSSL